MSIGPPSRPPRSIPARAGRRDATTLDEWQIVPAIWNHVRREVDSQVSRACSSSRAPRRRPTTRPAIPAGCALGGPDAADEPRRSRTEQWRDLAGSALLAGGASRSRTRPDGRRSHRRWSSEAAGQGSASCRSRMPHGRYATISIASGGLTSRRSTACVGIPSACRRSCEACAAPCRYAGRADGDRGGCGDGGHDGVRRHDRRGTSRPHAADDRRGPAGLEHAPTLQSRPSHHADAALHRSVARGRCAGRDPTTLLRDLNAFGLLFESMVIRDLRVYAQPFEGAVVPLPRPVRPRGRRDRRRGRALGRLRGQARCRPSRSCSEEPDSDSPTVSTPLGAAARRAGRDRGKRIRLRATGRHPCHPGRRPRAVASRLHVRAATSGLRTSRCFSRSRVCERGGVSSACSSATKPRHAGPSRHAPKRTRTSTRLSRTRPSTW